MISIILGLIFSDNIYLFSDKMAIRGTTTWGKACLTLGLILLFLIVIKTIIKDNIIVKTVFIIIIILIGIIQINLIVFWTVIGNKKAAYPINHPLLPCFIYYLPHILLITLSTFNSIYLIKK